MTGASVKTCLAAAVLALLAPLTPTPTASATSSFTARAGVDIAPPAVGTCHDLSYNEALADVDADPAVDCAERHTTQTVRVTQLGTVANWRKEWPEIVDRAYVPCLRKLVAAVGGEPRRLQLTALRPVFFRPTKAQRDAGAAWVRCDAVALGPDVVAPLPEDLTMPRGIDPRIHKCFQDSRRDYAQTVCSARYSYWAEYTRLTPGDTYPGERAAKAFAERKCRQVMEQRAGHWVYQWVGSRREWRAGLRYAVCGQPH